MAFRKTAVGLSILTVVLGALVVVPNFIDWSVYKQPALDAAQKATGFTITIDGDLSVRTLPMPHASVSGITVMNGADTLLKLKQADVRVALLPLLAGKVEVASVDLIEPVITIGKRADGSATWSNAVITPDTSSTSTTAQTDNSSNQPVDTKTKESFSLQNLQIEQGSLIYTDSSKGSVFTAESINTVLDAKTLKGPFSLSGSLKTTGRDVVFDVYAEAVPDGSKKVPVKIAVRLPAQEAQATYEGQVSSFSPLLLDGDFSAKTKSLSSFAGMSADFPLDIKTTLKATDTSIILDGFTGDLAGVSLAGSGGVENIQDGQRPKINLSITAQDVLPLDRLLESAKGGASKDNNQSSKVSSGHNQQGSAAQFLPAKLADAFPFDGVISLQAPGFVYKKQPTGPSTFSVTFSETQAIIKTDLEKLPGNSEVRFAGSLYPNPTKITGQISFQSNNLKTLLVDWLALSGADHSALFQLQPVTLKTEFALLRKSVGFADGSLKMQGSTIGFAGDYAILGVRPKLSLEVRGDSLDLDRLVLKSPAQKQTNSKSSAVLAKDAASKVESFSLPLDADVDLAFDKLIYEGDVISDAALKASLVSNRLSVSRFNVGNYKNASLSGRGTVGNLKDLSGLDIDITASAQNAEQVLKSFKIALPKLPKPLGNASVTIAAKGSKNLLETTTDLKAYGGTFTISGPLSDPLGTPALNDMSLRIRHSNLIELVQLAQPGYSGTPAMARPVDVSARISTQGKTYKINGLKGQAGPVAVSGNITADMTGKPSLIGALNFGALPLSDLMGVRAASSEASSETSGASSGRVRTERWSRAPINTDWMRSMDIDFDIKAESLTYNLWRLTNPKIDFNLKGGVMSVSSLSAGLFGGSIQGQGRLASGASNNTPVQMSMQATMNGVNARDLTNALSGNKTMNRIGGVVSFNIEVASNGGSSNALISALSGKGGSSGQNITITGIDLGKISQTATGSYKPIDRALVLQSALTSGQTTFETHQGTFSIANGIVNIDRNIFDGANSQLSTTGTINLPRWTVDTRHKIIVKQPADVPAFEFTFKGPLDHPAQNILGGALNSYLSSKLQGEATKLIDKKFGGKLNELGLGGLLGGAGRAASDQQAPETIEPQQQIQPDAPAQPQPEQKKLKPEDAVRGLLQGLIR